MPLIRKGCLKVMVSRRERMVMPGCLSQTALRRNKFQRLAGQIVAATARCLRHTFERHFNCRSGAVSTRPCEAAWHFSNDATGWDQVFRMKIRVGFEMIYDFPQPTPLIAVLGTHFTRASDILVPDYLTISPSVPITPYRDGFGNWCSRF